MAMKGGGRKVEPMPMRNICLLEDAMVLECKPYECRCGLVGIALTLCGLRRVTKCLELSWWTLNSEDAVHHGRRRITDRCSTLEIKRRRTSVVTSGSLCTSQKLEKSVQEALSLAAAQQSGPLSVQALQ
ncbi:hypothetical protein PAXRUDRAFT_835681 [Paxillus rubicundulus Ve08.2h10]|uniref:Uncharacterized protein n=1 Tax=Paxillus rubicundulus Ve08.2h10 TaxID=930991 RepID=A0A0D0BVN4_9AGAM|nr:hypothetical protein PAXRUDRAFT_835681 [Paxillus rubicundulus Ve08.2h10]